MEDIVLTKKMTLACDIAKSYFNRGIGSGTSGNLSFMHNGMIYITAGGSCFGFLTPDDFTAVPWQNGEDAPAPEKKPSKELPLHRIVYERLMEDGIFDGAVIHTHAPYSVLWSCVPDLDPKDCVPEVTPYLRMKMGACGLIPYEKPGSPELFQAFRENRRTHFGWILSHHGLLTGGKDLMEAFSRSEELEEACRISWNLRNAGLL